MVCITSDGLTSLCAEEVKNENEKLKRWKETNVQGTTMAFCIVQREG